MKIIKLTIISPLFFLLNFFYIDNLRSEINTNAIIKIFCKESVKSEFKKNNFEYEESIGEDVCNCYLINISNNISHKESISRCKLEKSKKI
tara:strand:+ start:209 stop:481 length:273 start_codon:yes stop_codon:yes gene_type:complete